MSKLGSTHTSRHVPPAGGLPPKVSEGRREVGSSRQNPRVQSSQRQLRLIDLNCGTEQTRGICSVGAAAAKAQASPQSLLNHNI